MEAKDRLLKCEEVAELLMCSVPQAYRMMQRGDIKTVRFGRLVRVLPLDLEAFIQEHRGGGGQ